jgi:hypothetical protein
VEDVTAAVRDAMRTAGPDATLCVLPQGPQTIPYLRTTTEDTEHTEVQPWSK